MPQGFLASGVVAGIKKNGKADVALIVSEHNCHCAAVFTTNKVKAAPIIRDQRIMKTHADRIRAVLINAGCANACTGYEGLKNAERSAWDVSHAFATDSSSLQPFIADQVFTMSTGVIGVHLPMEKLQAGIQVASQSISREGFVAAAEAIMTTDTVSKMSSMTRDGWSVWGMAKGAGMIHPNMATMLSVVMTDAVVSPVRLRVCLDSATKMSFNRVTVDGDTSTNDTLLVLANGASGVKPSREEFEDALGDVCVDLAKQIAKDGEGATKLITIIVTGAKNERMAERVAKTIANSPLVKTAFYGEDANWGRIVAAAGYSGEDVNPDRMSLWIGGVHVLAYSSPTHYKDEDATNAMKKPEVEVHLDLGLGDSFATVWTCDLSHEYVTVNGKYRT
jgi:glutamate N-acetyltransferase/amino-acid N-acetyltransferase